VETDSNGDVKYSCRHKNGCKLKGKRKLNNKIVKRLRKQYREKINGLAMRDLKNEIFRLARNRDILGIVLIAENIIFVIILFIFLILHK
jgi:uncharacterized protein YlxP (DUF503 family)